MRYLLVLCAIWLGGCLLANASPSKKLSDVVHEMNDSARWGRISSASNYVVADYRGRFQASHRRWGRGIRVADGEVLSVQFAPDRESAEAIVSYSWYDLSTMTLHDTVIRQTWRSLEESYGLFDETVIEGDESLLASN